MYVELTVLNSAVWLLRNEQMKQNREHSKKVCDDHNVLCLFSGGNAGHLWHRFHIQSNVFLATQPHSCHGITITTTRH